MPFTFPERGGVAIVTGAAGDGIGQATVRELAARGFDVVVTDKHAARNHAVAAQIRADFPDVKVLEHVLDVSDPRAADTVIASVLGEVGRVDVLVNNAAINILKPVTDLTDADWAAVMAVNIDGPFRLSRRVFPAMKAQGGGLIVNVTSYAGDVGGAGIETPYAVSKGALNTLTRCLAHEGGPHGIRVNSVSPGLTAGTKFVEANPEVALRADATGPLGEIATKDEVAGVIAFLTTPAANHITGEVFNVSGGAYMRN